MTDTNNTTNSDPDSGSDSGAELPDPPPTPEPPMYEEWEDVETWTQANLRYPVPGGWDIADHGRFHTTWKHEDGAKLTRSYQRTAGQRDTFAFRINGEEVHSVETGPERVAMREETVWLLQFYDETTPDSVDELRDAIRRERNHSLFDF